MKVGHLNFLGICGGLIYIVIGANPCACLGATLCMYGLAGGVLIGMAYAMEAGVMASIIWALIAWNTLIFLRLCLSNPGVAP